MDTSDLQSDSILIDLKIIKIRFNKSRNTNETK